MKIIIAWYGLLLENTLLARFLDRYSIILYYHRMFTNEPILLRGQRRFTVSLLKFWQSKGMGTRDIADILGIGRDSVKRLLKKPDHFPVDSETFNHFTARQGDINDYVKALKSGEVPSRSR